jgi:hypothetical protein
MRDCGKCVAHPIVVGGWGQQKGTDTSGRSASLVSAGQAIRERHHEDSAGSRGSMQGKDMYLRRRR